jgi:hypothetical protein
MSAEAVTSEPANLLRDSTPRIVTRVVTLIATVTLGAAVLFRSPSDFRTGLCIIVSLAAAAVVVRSLFTGNFLWTLLFLGVLGVFTPFHRTQFSHIVISILDMATLALLAASPIILGKSARSFVRKHSDGNVVITRD